MKKLFALVLCLMLALSALTVVHAETSDLSAHLRVLYPGTSDLEKEIAEDIANALHEKYPNIEVEYIFLAWSDIETKMAVMVSTGDYPDVMQIQDAANPVAMGALEPIQPWIEGSSEVSMDNFSPVGCEKFSVDGTLYAVPMTLIPYSHIVNTELFEKVGIDPAGMKTWDDVVAAAKAISELGDDYYGFAMANGGEGRFTFRDFMMICLTNGFTPDDTSDETKPAYLEALKFVADLAPYMPESQSTWLYPDLFKAWESGKVGIMHTGTYFTGNVVDHGVASLDRTAVCPLPAGPSAEKTAMMVGSCGYAMFAGSTQKEAAWAFIETAISPDVLGKLAGSMNVSAVDYLSEETLVEWTTKAYASHGDDIGAKHIALMSQFQEKANEYGIPMPTILGQSAMEKVVQGAIVKLTNNGCTVEEAYDEIKAGIEEVKASL